MTRAPGSRSRDLARHDDSRSPGSAPHDDGQSPGFAPHDDGQSPGFARNHDSRSADRAGDQGGRAADVARALAELPPPGPLTLRLAGGGRFGPVLWAGLAGDVDRLATFREDMRSTLVKAGFAVDERPFRPHLTVSYRFHRGIDQALRDYAGPLWRVDDFSLVLSESGEYHRLHTWPTHQPPLA